ncbi:Imidazole glycerol phosphate synthase amidotransferase subunit [hydrothermal vent metagenome]|uniref:Imidazole glycerol phosphate synthase amidotransferase subunit n=1 Tax=hydrothermal vent metagenome TaxID=652676 RepID=A0A3B0TNY5_9ZZZZ
MTTVAIVDYGSGNLRSAEKSFQRAAREAGTGHLISVTSDPDAVRRAERVVLPGVGAFADCRTGLEAVPGMSAALAEAATTGAKPFFGICVGMQLMATTGHEHRTTPGFGWIDGAIDRIAPSDPTLKIPHMGWNTLDPVNDHPCFDGIALGPDGAHAYFVHSYGFTVADPANLIATTDHGGAITAAIARENLFGTQFHPEKSQRLGLALIGNFLKWRP